MVQNTNNLDGKLSFEEVLSCIKIIKSAREKQDEKVVKDLLLKYVDGYVSNVYKKNLIL